MRTLSRLHCLIAVMGVLAASLVHAQDIPAVTLPDASEGNVDGRQGVSFWPAVIVNGEERATSPSGCVVYLVPSDVNQRLAHDCGKWFAPAPGRYTVWLEQGDRISHQTVISTPGAKFAGNGVVVVIAMKDAGLAALAPDVPLGVRQTVRFLSIEPSTAGFDKRLQPSEAKSTVRLPAGRAIAGIFGADGSTLALTRPFTTAPGKITLVSPRAPGRAADLMVVLGKRRAPLAERRAASTKISALVGGKEQQPGVLHENDGRVIAIWYAIPAGSAKLKLASTVFRLDEREIRLASGTVTTIREDLDLDRKGVAP